MATNLQALVTCGLTAEDRDWLRNPMFVSSMGLPWGCVTSNNPFKLVLIWVMIQVQVFKQNFYHHGIGRVVGILWDQLPWQMFVLYE